MAWLYDQLKSHPFVGLLFHLPPSLCPKSPSFHQSPPFNPAPISAVEGRMMMSSRIQSSRGAPSSPLSFVSGLSILSSNVQRVDTGRSHASERRRRLVVRASGGSLGGRWRQWWEPPAERFKALAESAPCLSDVVWPSAGAFAAMALLGRLDQAAAHRGLSFTIAPLGAVCAVLFTTPTSPAAKKYNMFVAQIGCAAFGVLALFIFGPGWLARGAALAASIAFMIVTGASHPPAASLPILFIDGAKFHHLNMWYALFPGATGCLLLCLIQEVVTYLKKNCKF